MPHLMRFLHPTSSAMPAPDRKGRNEVIRPKTACCSSVNFHQMTWFGKGLETEEVTFAGHRIHALFL
jgi:hypothetical protein